MSLKYRIKTQINSPENRMCDGLPPIVSFLLIANLKIACAMYHPKSEV